MMDEVAELNTTWRSTFVSAAHRERLTRLDAAGVHFRWESAAGARLRFTARDAAGALLAHADAWVGATKELLVSLVLDDVEARIAETQPMQMDAPPL